MNRPVGTLLVAVLCLLAPLSAGPAATAAASHGGTTVPSGSDAPISSASDATISSGSDTLVPSGSDTLVPSGSDTPILSASDATTPPTNATALSATDDDIADNEIRQTTTLYRTPDDPGTIRVEFAYTFPDYLAQFTLQLPQRVTVLDRKGFVPDGTATFRWDKSTTNPTITFRLPVNQTGSESGFERPLFERDSAGLLNGSAAENERFGSANVRADHSRTDANDSRMGHSRTDATHSRTDTSAADPNYLFVDTGPWALVELPGYYAEWPINKNKQAPEFSERVRVNGPGAAGSEIAFLGQQRTYTRTAHGQTVRLIVPANADLEPRPRTVLDGITNASDALRVGDRDEELFFVAVPTSVNLAVRGLQVGDSDAWVAADEPLRTADNVWFHEYVHTRQDYSTTDASRWITEGSADYYAALLSLQLGLIDFADFRTQLQFGQSSAYRDVVLAQPDTWTRGAQYRKGALVAGELDRRIRLASDRSASFETVLSRMNADTDNVTGAEIRSFVTSAGDSETGDAATRFTETTATPDVWNRSAHTAAFGTKPAQISVSVASLSVSGQYRNRTLSTLTFLPNETLSIRTLVSNEGGTAGEYRVVAALDGEPFETRTGRLAAETTTNETMTYTFERTGTFTLTVNGAEAVVRVREPARPTVTGVSLNRSRVGDGDPVEVTVSVGNDADRPAVGNVSVVLDGERVAVRQLRLDSGVSRTLSFVVHVAGTGSHTVTVGSYERTLTVETPTPTPTATATDSPTPATATATEGGDGSANTGTAGETATVTAGDGSGDDSADGQSGEDGENSDGGDDEDIVSTTAPGFGVTTVIVAAVVLFALVRLRWE
jgi:hypothetical protein